MDALDDSLTYFIDGCENMEARFMGCLLDHSYTQSQSASVTDQKKIRTCKEEREIMKKGRGKC